MGYLLSLPMSAYKLNEKQVEELYTTYPQLEDVGNGKVVQRFDNKEEVTLEFILGNKTYWCFSDPYTGDTWYQK